MKGLLLINLGSPDSTSIPDVKKYLDEFLMDKRVIGKSYLFRWILVKLIILNFRPKKSAKAYKKIWWKEGSPLIVLSQRLFKKISKILNVHVSLAMRYGSMSILKGLTELNNKGVHDIVVLPLYPHYAMSSYETVVEKVKEETKKNFPKINISFIDPFYNDPDYIKLLSKKIKDSIIYCTNYNPYNNYARASIITARCTRIRTVSRIKWMEANTPNAGVLRGQFFTLGCWRSAGLAA